MTARTSSQPAIHPVRCDCRACPAPVRASLLQRIADADPDARGDLYGFAWGAMSGAIVGAILILNHFGPAIVAALHH